MKNFLLLAGLCAWPALAQAQTEKGQGIWTGNASFAFISNKTEQTQTTGFYRTTQSGLSFNRGVFFKDNWLVGGELSLGLTTTGNETKTTSQSFDSRFTNFTSSLNGFVRRYWGKDIWRVFLGGGLAFGYGSARDNYDDNTNDADQNYFSITPIVQAGANYYLTNRIGVEASVTSNSFPMSFNSFGVGLLILTGGNTINSSETYEAPQTAKGRWVLGGGFSFSTRETNGNRPGVVDEQTNTFTISPSVGWFVKKNLLLGIAVPIEVTSTKLSSTFSYGINPYLKKYISDNRLRPFIAGDINFLTARNKSKVNNTISTARNATLSASAGLAYLLGDRFIVEATLGEVNIGRTFYPKERNINSWNGGASATLQPGFTLNYVLD